MDTIKCLKGQTHILFCKARLICSLLIPGICFSLLACKDEGFAPYLPEASQTTFNCSDVTINTTSSLGTNLVGWRYFNDSHWMAVDAFSKASEWRATSPTLGWNAGTITSYDTSGWPTGVSGDTTPEVELFVGIRGQYPRGTYVIHWEGTGGTLAVDGNATNLRCETGTAISSCPTKRGLFDVTTTSNTGFYVRIVPDNPATYNAGNYINNIRVIMPGGVCGRATNDLDYIEHCATSRGGFGSCGSGESCYDFDDVDWDRFNDPDTEINNPKVVFHPASLRDLRKFRSLRFMDWMRIQQTTVAEWADRTLVTDYSLGLDNGVPPIYMIKLSNILNADPWFSVPHLSSNDYNDQFAALVLAELNPGLDIYLEFTNEIWNPDQDEYPQANWALQQAVTNNVGVGQPDYIRQSMYYAQRAAEVFDRWTGVFGGSASRITRVLSPWVSRTDTATAMLAMPGVLGKTDALAMAPYFGTYLTLGEMKTRVEQWDLFGLFHEFFTGGAYLSESPRGAVDQINGYVDEMLAVANANGLDLVAYEGGEHLWSTQTESNTTLKNLFEAAVRDSRMGTAYKMVLEHWRDSGAKLFNNFVYMADWRIHQFGMYQDQYSTCEEYPKAGAINEFIIENPCWWPSCNQ